jgi:hypothetical protein
MPSLLWQVWVTSPTLLRMVEVEHFINERTHILNTLRFWVNVWCPTRLWSCSWTKCWWSPGYPLVTQQWYQSRWFNEGFDRLLVSKVFPTKVVRRRVLLSTTTVVQVYGWRKLPLEGEHNELNDSHLRGRMLWQVWGKSHIA